MKIIHLITSLTEGGAQSLLFEFIKSDKSNIHIVISIKDNGRYIKKLNEIGVEVHLLNFESLLDFLKSINKLFLILNIEKANIIHSWLYHANLVTFLVRIMNPKMKIIWAIHNFSISLKSISLKTLFVVYLNAFSSYFVPNNIVFASECAIKSHIKIGFNKKVIKLIRNGINTEYFKPFSNKRTLKDDLNLRDKIVMAMIARYDKVKDHKNLINSLKYLKDKRDDWAILLIGENMDSNNLELMHLLDNANIKQNVFCLGVRKDIKYILNSIDFCVLSSYSEDQPIVLIESMSCGKLCIATNVGSIPLIINKFGWLVPKSNPFELFKAFLNAFDTDNESLKNLSNSARNHICKSFSIKKMICEYNLLYAKFNKKFY